MSLATLKVISPKRTNLLERMHPKVLARALTRTCRIRDDQRSTLTVRGDCRLTKLRLG